MAEEEEVDLADAEDCKKKKLFLSGEKTTTFRIFMSCVQFVYFGEQNFRRPISMKLPVSKSLSSFQWTRSNY